jgi:heme/copper-type cytochrome/quinol oxidase subunit 1
MNFVRAFGILILGVILVAVGIVGYVAFIPGPSFGWSAYAPLTNVTFTPYPNLWFLAVAVIGLILAAGWIGHRMGRRQAR